VIGFALVQIAATTTTPRGWNAEGTLPILGQQKRMFVDQTCVCLRHAFLGCLISYRCHRNSCPTTEGAQQTSQGRPDLLLEGEVEGCVAGNSVAVVAGEAVAGEGEM
jgi:hypothetical protein